MKRIFLTVIFLSILFFVSCTDSGSSDITWRGNWMSTKNYDERGTFIFDLEIENEELTGTMTIPGMGISDLQVEGIVERGYDPIWHGPLTGVLISDVNGRVEFFAVVYTHDIDSDTRLDGDYTDNANADSGNWYCSDDSREDFSSISSFSLDSLISDPRGLCFDGNYLWLSETHSSSIANIYKIDATNGMIVDSFDVSGTIERPQGFAWDGSSIWCVGSDGLYELDTLCSVLSSVTGVTLLGLDITYASGYIWCAGPFFDELQKIDPSNGNVVNTYDFTIDIPTGFAFDGNSLWICDMGSSYHWPLIFKVDLSGNILDIYNSPCSWPLGLAFGDSYLYCIDDLHHRIYKLGI